MLLVVGGSIALAIAATSIVRKRVPEEVHRSNNEVAGFMFAAVGVVYGVMLAFVVLVVWQAYLDAVINAEREANTLVNIFRIGQEQPAPYNQQMAAAVVDYTQKVIGDEWRQMELGQESPAARDALEQLWAVHRAMHSSDQPQILHQDYFFDAMEDLGNERRIRLLASREELPVLMWVLLAGGAIVTLGFTLFFRVPNSLPHFLMVGLFAGLVGFVLFLILELDSPFNGEIHVSSLPFQQSLDLIQRLQGK